MARYYSVVALNFAVFLSMLGVGMIVALLPQRIISLSASVSDVGYLASAFALTYVLLQIPIGNLSDRFGYKPFLVGGYFICALTGLLYYFSNTSRLIFLGRMLQGMGEIPIWAIAPALLSVRFPARKGSAIGMYNGFFHFGLTAGSLMGIFIHTSWEGNKTFLLYAFFCFLSGLIIALFVNEPHQKGYAKPTKFNSKYLLSIMDNSKNRIVLFGILLYGSGYGIFITLIPAYLISAKDFNHTTVGAFFALFYIAISLSQLTAGPFSDRQGRIPIMIIGLAMTAIGLAAFSGLEWVWLMGFLTLSAFGLGVFGVSALAFLNETVPGSLKGTISGAFYFSWGAGYFLGPLVVGHFCRLGYWEMGFFTLAGLFSLAALALSITPRRTNKAIEMKR